MAMDPAALKQNMELRIYNGLKAEFSASAAQGQGYTPIADEHWHKLAKAISGIAVDIVLEITTKALVNPGIATAGGPSNQVTISPGTIS